MATANKKDPSIKSAANEKMAPRIALTNALMVGTEALQGAGEEYLPRYEAESEPNYKARLQRSVLVNYFRRTVESLVGKPFSKPVVIESDMPEALTVLADNIDKQGNSLDVFAKRVFQDGLAKGLTHILVEFPNTQDAGVETAADEQALGATPYFVHIPAESILAAYSEMRNGEEFLTHVRIYETKVERVGFEEVETEYVRILEPGSWQLWEKKEKKWVLEESGTTSLDFIPLVTFYTDREDFMVARPPLTDLAYVNLAHYQSGSDQRNILTVARFPMLAVTGTDDDSASIKVGPRQLLSCTDKDGKFYYVEHSGAAIEAGRNDMKDLEEQMSVLGVELLTKSGDMTATAKSIDTAENLSMLQTMTIMFADALSLAFQFAGAWMGIAPTGTIKINTEFGLAVNSQVDLTTIQSARTSGDISREAFIHELQRRNVLDSSYDPVADKLIIEEEINKSMADQALSIQMQQDAAAPTEPVA